MLGKIATIKLKKFIAGANILLFWMKYKLAKHT